LQIGLTGETALKREREVITIPVYKIIDYQYSQDFFVFSREKQLTYQSVLLKCELSC